MVEDLYLQRVRDRAGAYYALVYRRFDGIETDKTVISYLTPQMASAVHRSGNIPYAADYEQDTKAYLKTRIEELKAAIEKLEQEALRD